MMEHDPELLRRYAQDGSEAAFAELVRRHLGLVYHAALRQLGGDAHGAADVAQSVFIDLARQARKLQDRPVIASWLHTAVRYAAAKRRRSEQTRRTYEEAAVLREAEPSAQWDRLRPWIDGALEELAEADRNAVFLRFFEGASFAEVGGALRLSEDAARMRVQRALDKMQGLLARHGITSTASALGLLLADQAAAATPADLAVGFVARAVAAASTAGSAMPATVLSKLSLAFGAGALALSLATLGFVGFGLRRIAQESAQTAAAERSLAALQEQEKVSQDRMQTLDGENASLRDRLRQRAKAAVAGSAQTTAAGSWNAQTEGDKFLARHPEVKVALEAYGRGRVRWEYGALIASFHLTPADADRLMAMMDGGGLGLATPDYRKNLMLVYGNASAPGASGDPSDLLSSEQIQQLRAAERLKFQRDIVTQLAGRLWDTPDPLAPDQGAALIQALAPLPINTPGGGDPEAVLQQARSVLSPGQLAALQDTEDAKALDRAMNARQP